MAELFKALESRDLGFYSQHPHEGSQLSVTPVSGSGLQGYQAHMWCIDIRAGKVLIPIKTKTKTNLNKISVVRDY